MFVNIAARVYTKRIINGIRHEEEKYTFIYNTAEFVVEKTAPKMEEETPLYIKGLIAMGVSLFVIMIFVMIYIWMRMKKAEKILKYEVETRGIQMDTEVS